MEIKTFLIIFHSEFQPCSNMLFLKVQIIEKCKKKSKFSKFQPVVPLKSVVSKWETHLILSMIYLSGMRPSRPFKEPLHQS